MKNLLTTTVVVALVVAFTNSMTWARNPSKPVVYSSTCELIVPTDAPEPRATGQVNLASILPAFDVEVAVNCKRLTPLANYRVVCQAHWRQTDPSSGLVMSDDWWDIRTFTTDGKGVLKGQFHVAHWICEPWVSVSDLWIENEAGQVVLQVKWQ